MELRLFGAKMKSPAQRPRVNVQAEYPTPNGLPSFPAEATGGIYWPRSWLQISYKIDKQNSSTMATTVPIYRIASIPGDGIGTEVVAATIQVIQKLAQSLGTFHIDFTHLPWGSEYYKQHGRYVSEGHLDILRQFDATLFGAVGAPGTYQCPMHTSTTLLTVPL